MECCCVPVDWMKHSRASCNAASWPDLQTSKSQGSREFCRGEGESGNGKQEKTKTKTARTTAYSGDQRFRSY